MKIFIINHTQISVALINVCFCIEIADKHLLYLQTKNLPLICLGPKNGQSNKQQMNGYHEIIHIFGKNAYNNRGPRQFSVRNAITLFIFVEIQ